MRTYIFQEMSKEEQDRLHEQVNQKAMDLKLAITECGNYATNEERMIEGILFVFCGDDDK